MIPLARIGQGALAAAAVAGVALFLVYACTAPKEGYVEGAWLEPAHSETYQSGTICYSYDKNGACTFSMPIYSERWVPDECYVKINDTATSRREATWQIACQDLAYFEAKKGQWVSLK